MKKFVLCLTAVLFAAGEPVELKRLSEAVGCETGEVEEAANRPMGRLGFERRGVRVTRGGLEEGVGERLAGFEMAGRLIEADAIIGFFFDEQEFAVAFDHGSDRDIGFPDHLASLGDRAKRPFYRHRGHEFG